MRIFARQPTAAVMPERLEGSRLPDSFFARYAGPLRKYFRSRVYNPQDVEDLVQEVFCRLSERAELDQIENQEGYLFQTAANLLRDRARREQTRSSANRDLTDMAENSFEEISPERVLLGKRRVEELTRALMELPERTRVIFLLHRFEDRKYGEIARQLGISVSSVEKHMMDAIRHLKARQGQI